MCTYNLCFELLSKNNKNIKNFQPKNFQFLEPENLYIILRLHYVPGGPGSPVC